MLEGWSEARKGKRRVASRESRGTRMFGLRRWGSRGKFRSPNRPLFIPFEIVLIDHVRRCSGRYQ